MKRTINLLSRRRTYQYKEKIFGVLRTITILIGVLCVGALGVVFFLKTREQLYNKALLSRKEEYLTELLTKKDIEKKVVYFNEKSIAVDNLLKNDVRFLPYYRLLVSYLPQGASGSADLAEMQYDNKREASFTLNFPDSTDFYNVLDYFEEERFLSIFEKLTLKEFPVSDEPALGGFQVVFNGRFKPIP